MKDNSPKVSVVIPVYNGEHYLGTAIDSILAQTYTDFELVIINDGSTDHSSKLISEYDDFRIRIIENETNLGLTATRNIGLENSKGEYIAILDCDDYAHSNRLAEQVTYLDDNPDFALVGSWAEVLRDDVHGDGEFEILKFDAPVEHIPSILLFSNYFVQSSVMLRKSVIPEPAYRDFAPAEDYDLWVRLAKEHKLGILQYPLVRYRIHELNISQRQASIQEEAVREIISAQLHALGIKPSNEEMELHRLLVAEKSEMSHERLRAVEEWLKKIKAANNTQQIYDSTALFYVVGARWKTACKHLCEEHPGAFFKCLASELSKGHRAAFVSSAFKWLRSKE